MVAAANRLVAYPEPPLSRDPQARRDHLSDAVMKAVAAAAKDHGAMTVVTFTRAPAAVPVPVPVPVPAELPRDRDTFHLLLRE